MNHSFVKITNTLSRSKEPLALYYNNLADQPGLFGKEFIQASGLLSEVLKAHASPDSSDSKDSFPCMRLYVCGVTVYDHLHLGHARLFVVFDAWVRFLREMGIRVYYVRNFTDVDDKIIQKAYEKNITPKALALEMMQSALEDERRLGLLPVDASPKATEYIEAMVEMIQSLIEKGYAYQTDKGNVYFRVKRFKAYGALSGKKLQELEQGVRIENEPDKEDPVDFALWKQDFVAHPKQGEVFSTLLGQGRPGWHIECSAMIKEILGEVIEVHGGGPDLIFPHHENEIAQSKSCGHEFAKQWMHVGPLKMQGEKMSKSLGNFVVLKDALNSELPDVIRHLLLSTHYRSPMDLTPQMWVQSRRNVLSLYEALLVLENEQNELQASGQPKPESSLLKEPVEAWIEALGDDFNTPLAFRVLLDLANQAQKLKGAEAVQVADTMKKLGQSIGFFQESNQSLLKAYLGVVGRFSYHNPSGFVLEPLHKDLSGEKDKQSETFAFKTHQDAIGRLLIERNEAKQQKDFQKADKIRSQLESQGYGIRDAKEGLVLVDLTQETLWRQVQKDKAGA